MKYYRYTDLVWLNRCLYTLLFPPAILTIIGLLHGLYSLQRLRGQSSLAALDSLNPDLSHMLMLDGILRVSQISLTILMLTFFAFCWLYYAKRNLIALFQQVEHCLINNLKQFANLFISIFFSLRMMRELWRTSIPKNHRHGIQHWLVPVWWVILIAANSCKIVAVVLLAKASTVGDWFNGYEWMLAAYCFYFPLYILTWRLVNQLARYQKIQWQQLMIQSA